MSQIFVRSTGLPVPSASTSVPKTKTPSRYSSRWRELLLLSLVMSILILISQ